MTDRTGGCLCGQVRYRLTAEPVVARICWCRDCQHLAGNGTANAIFPTDHIEITGTTAAYASQGDSGNTVRRRFCPACGSHLFADSTGRPGLTVVRLGTLDDPSTVRPVANIWAASAPAWACLDPALGRIEGQPAPPRMAAPHAGPPVSSLRPMTEAEYQAWLDSSIPAYAADKVASGQWAEADALALSKAENDGLLPQGMQTPGNHFFTIVDGEGAPVGMLWFAEKTKFNARIAFVFDVGVNPDRRRQGHALRAFQDLEAEVRRLGLSGIALHVFGHNAGARALYARLGFQPTNLSLYKPLSV